MSGVLCMQGGNLPDLLGSVTVTVGKYVIPIPPQPDIVYWGLSFTQGSVTPTTWGSSGMPFILLCWVDSTTVQTNYFSLRGYIPNTGWTTITINGTPYNRADGAYAYDANNNQTYWYWSTAFNAYGTTVGATKTVTWS